MMRIFLGQKANRFSMTFSALALIPQLPSLDKIKQIRLRLDISQRELAKSSGVSQSLIAKIEGERVDPSYEKVRAIFNAFEEIMKSRLLSRDELEIQFTVGDLASKKIICVNPETSLVETIEKMLRGHYAQLPVMKKGQVVGSISEGRIKDYILGKCKENIDSKEIMLTKIGEVMGPPFTILDESTPIEIAAIHLHHEDAVLIMRKGAISGILTSSDYLGLGLQ